MTSNLSSGNPFLDHILQGGFQPGSTILFIEDSPSKISNIFFKYSISESLINNQFILYYSQSKTNLNFFYKSTQIENILNSKNISKEKNEMKIAWRYENINYYNLISDFNKNLKYIFDLSRELQENLYEKNQIKTENVNYENLNDFLNVLVKDINNLEENNNNFIIKIFICDFMEFVNDFNHNQLKTFLINLKCVAKCLNGNVFINVNSNQNKKIINLIKEFSDYNFYIKPLFLLSEKEKIAEYDAIFSILKLPRINCLNNNINIDCDSFGIIKDKRKIIIEKIDIGVEVDRNTKIKEFEIKDKNLDF